MNKNIDFENKNDKILISLLQDKLKESIEDVQGNFPFSLKVKHMMKITNYSSDSIYKMLEEGKIPSAKKIKGWRVPRDIFVLWWFGLSEKNIKNYQNVG